MLRGPGGRRAATSCATTGSSPPASRRRCSTLLERPARGQRRAAGLLAACSSSGSRTAGCWARSRSGRPGPLGALLLAALVDRPDRYATATWSDLLEHDRARTSCARNLLAICAGSAEDETRRRGGAGRRRPAAAGGRRDGRRSRPGALHASTSPAGARRAEIDPVFGRDREIRQMIDILAPAAQEQPDHRRRGRGRQDGARRGPGAAHRRRATSRRSCTNVRAVSASTSGCCRPAPACKGEFENRLKQVITRGQGLARSRSSSSSTRRTRSSAPAARPAAATRPTCSSRRWPAASCAPSRPPPGPSTRSTSRRTPPWSAASSRSSCDEPSEDDAVMMLRGLRDKYEEAHKVRILDEAVVAAAQLSSRYISGRQLPDKAVDLLDTRGRAGQDRHRGPTRALEDARAADPDARTRTGRPGARPRPRPRRSTRPDRASSSRASKPRRPGRATSRARWKRGTEVRRPRARAARARSRSRGTRPATRSPPATPRRLRPRPRSRRAGAAADGRRAAPAAASCPRSGPAHAETELERRWRSLRELQGKDAAHPTSTSTRRWSPTWSPTGPASRSARWCGTRPRRSWTLDDRLRERIKGQDHALEAIGARHPGRQGRARQPQRRRSASSSFVGPSGVGKTETALGRGRPAVRRRALHGHDQHVRVPGEAHRLAASSARRRATSATARAAC